MPFVLLLCKVYSLPERLWAPGADNPAGSAAVTYISSPQALGVGAEVSR